MPVYNVAKTAVGRYYYCCNFFLRLFLFFVCVAVGFHRCIVYLCCRIELTCFFFVHLHTFKFPVVEIPKWSKPFLLCQCLHQRYMRVDLLFFLYISLVCVCTFYDISLNRWLGCSLTASFSHCGLKHTYSSIYVFIRY